MFTYRMTDMPHDARFIFQIKNELFWTYFLQNGCNYHLFQNSLSRFAYAPLDGDQIICYYSNIQHLKKTWPSPFQILHFATVAFLLHQ